MVGLSFVLTHGMTCCNRVPFLSPSLVNADERLDRFALGLRLLYVSDIRELQSQVDELIVAMQECTANPKTNTSLGKVGR